MKKVFKLWKYVQWLQNLQSSPDSIEKIMDELKNCRWMYACDGLTEDEMNKLGYITKDEWTIIEGDISKQEKEHELLNLYRKKQKLELEKNMLGYIRDRKKGSLMKQAEPYNNKINLIAIEIKELEEELGEIE